MIDDIELTDRRRETIEQESDSVLARQTAEGLAADVGFEETAQSELGLVATELATNVYKHADGGEITIAKASDGERRGLRIESHDAGPGIEDIDAAFEDGVSSSGTLGSGLGAVNRLMDRVSVSSPGEPDYGTHVVADRWLRPTSEPQDESPLSIGAATRPKPTEEVNGDTFVIKRWDRKALVGVIDGLGHGNKAHEASTTARQYVDTHYDAPIASIFEGAERACRGTRGVVMALARFDWDADTVTVGSVGNINYKASGPDDLRILPRRGVVGNRGPEPSVSTADWDPGYRLVLFSDGLTSHWEFDDYTSLFEKPATVVASGLLDRLAKDSDDATVLVVTEDTQQG